MNNKEILEKERRYSGTFPEVMKWQQMDQMQCDSEFSETQIHSRGRILIPASEWWRCNSF
jgi:hypothetical protein